MNTLKTLAPYVTALLLFGAWFALVMMGKAPSADFLTALTGALSGLGVHGVHQAISAKAVNNAQS